MHRALILAASAALCAPVPAAAQEAFVGAYVHEVDTPFTLQVGERGADIALGYRFAPLEALAAIGRPAPYVIGALNTAGDTSFAGVGLAWTIGQGPVYVRPAVGVVVHDGPDLRIDPATRRHTELGSRVLFEPEIGVGYRLSERVSLEAHWIHISQGQLFNRRQNPGIDMVGARLNLRL